MELLRLCLAESLRMCAVTQMFAHGPTTVGDEWISYNYEYITVPVIWGTLESLDGQYSMVTFLIAGDRHTPAMFQTVADRVQYIMMDPIKSTLLDRMCL